MDTTYIALRRLVIASIRIILIQEKIKAFENVKYTAILENQKLDAPVSVIIWLNLTIQEFKSKLDLLKLYVKTRLELLLIGDYEYNEDDFTCLTRKDLKKGYIYLDQDLKFIFILTTGEVIESKDLKTKNLQPLEDYFNLTWPL